MGWGLRPRPLGFNGFSAMNSAQENSACCGSGASSLWPFPLTGAGAWPFPFPLAWWPFASFHRAGLLDAPGSARRLPHRVDKT